MRRGIDSPAFLCLSPDGRSLFAASEVPERPEGVIGSCAVSPADGSLGEPRFQSMGGAWASYLTTDAEGRVLLLADYGEGGVALLPVGADGSLGEVASAHQHRGAGPDAERQDGPHAHCAVIAPAGHVAFAADLGADRVFGYKLDLERFALVPHSELELAPGSGPRHLAFSPDGRHAYLVCELDSRVVVLDCDQDAGRLSMIEAHALLPVGFGGSSHAADIGIHPTGRFLYASNRGHDSIAMFAIAGDGCLQPLGHRSTEGATPRNFALSPDGRFLLVGNQDSDTIVTLPIDAHTGLLGESVSVMETPTPVCLVFSRA